MVSRSKWSAKREPPLCKGSLGRSCATAVNYNLSFHQENNQEDEKGILQ